MKQRRQKGSILGFVLVGAVLTALVVGGVFAAKRYIAMQQTSESTDTAVVKEPTKETTKTTNSGDATPSSNSNDLQKALQEQSAAEKKAQEQKAASERASSAPSNSSTAPSSQSSSSTSTTRAESLPATGPEDSLIAMLGATLLAGAVVAYRRSRALI